MTVGLACLLGFAGWTLLILMLGIGSVRIFKVVTGAAKANAFAADVPHGSDRYRRTMRAHANCVENLPVFAAVVVTSALIGARGGLFDVLPQVYLAARVAQSTTHIASGSSAAVNVRFTFFVLQLVCVICLGLLVAAAA
jgi:uncharacterized MAPEG superfamily protein